MKPLIIKVADSSYEKLVRAAEKCGFRVVGGKKHCKVKTFEGNFVTVIPRKNKIKRETARGIAETFKKFGGNIEIV